MTIIGSGLTAGPPYSMPTMVELGNRVSEGLRDLPTIEAALVDRFDIVRASKVYETAIAEITELDTFGDEIVEIVHAAITVGDVLEYEKLLHEQPRTALGRFIAMLQQSTASPALFVTTNYDRVIEYEFGRQTVRCFTGFSGGYISEYGEDREPYRPSVPRGGSMPRGVAAFIQVEVFVRKAGGFPDDAVGVKLMRQAFHPKNGPLTIPENVAAEREAAQHLFAGAIGYYKNQFSHRVVGISDAVRAASLILMANELYLTAKAHTLLAEQRKAAGAPPP